MALVAGFVLWSLSLKGAPNPNSNPDPEPEPDPNPNPNSNPNPDPKPNPTPLYPLGAMALLAVGLVAKARRAKA